jgi:hypothetical protein
MYTLYVAGCTFIRHIFVMNFIWMQHRPCGHMTWTSEPTMPMTLAIITSPTSNFIIVTY